MNLKKIKDNNSKTWFVDYVYEDGNETFGPATHSECLDFIKSNESRVESGEKFEVLEGPYQKEEPVEDKELDLNREVESSINDEVLYEVSESGRTTIKVPHQADPSEFAKACIAEINWLMDDPDINIFHDLNLNYSVNENGTVTIYVE